MHFFLIFTTYNTLFQVFFVQYQKEGEHPALRVPLLKSGEKHPALRAPLLERGEKHPALWAPLLERGEDWGERVCLIVFCKSHLNARSNFPSSGEPVPFLTGGAQRAGWKKTIL
jgi:hypothetical protein